MSAYLELQHFWMETKAGISTEGIAEQRIVELERRYSISLPDGFRQYLSLLIACWRDDG